ncbi:MAG: hypothetical protein LBK54_09880 [Propionibacteriaceae bacterium]|jgi:hypothetical protein|nr:hypothetical protein [Propionibacteriaceae bacterium]
MRSREVWREAGRNLASGTTRGLIGLVVLAVGLGLLVWLQTSGLADLARQADAFRRAGAAIQVVSAPGRIDGAQCDALASHPAVAAAGALRPAADLRLAVLPSTTVAAFEATWGLAQVLGVQPLGAVTQPTGSPGGDPTVGDSGTAVDSRRAGGVWLAQDLAATLGPNDQMTLLTGDQVTVAGVFPYPSDGRAPTLSFALVAPVPAQGVFDACWVELWPETDLAADWLTWPVLSGPVGAQSAPAQAQQLNTGLGLRFGAADRLAGLPLRPLAAASLAFGAGLGFVLIRTRRLELASALHAGQSRAALIGQVLIETAGWLLPAVALLLAWSAGTAGWDNPSLRRTAFWAGARSVGLAATGLLLAAGLTAGWTKERHLFRYFKNR